jgi:hypothetical protein
MQIPRNIQIYELLDFIIKSNIYLILHTAILHPTFCIYKGLNTIEAQLFEYCLTNLNNNLNNS